MADQIKTSFNALVDSELAQESANLAADVTALVAEHRLRDDGQGCICGKTWAVMIEVEGRPMAAEAHSSGRSISALFSDSQRACYHIWLSRRGQPDTPISYDYPHVLMLEEGDSVWAVPPATW